MIKDNITIFRGFFEEFHNTGSCFQSSRWAAQALTLPLRKAHGSKVILEVGAGTGPVTEKILKDMRPGDKLTVCEINSKFMAVLKEKLEKNPYYHQHRANVRFFEGPIQDLPEDLKYDVIVCALPFLNFEIGLVQEIFEKLHRIAEDDAVMTWYEYIGIRSISKVVSPSERKRRIREIEKFYREIQSTHEIGKERVWLNILPINVFSMRMAA